MTDNAYDRVRIEMRGHVGLVTLDRPERRNALDTTAIEEIPRAVTDLAARAETRAIVITGAGSAFCAGLDLHELGSSGENLGLPDRPQYPWPWRSDVPVIGAVNGPAIAGGFELALHCDFLVASTTAVFGDTHARIGQFPGAGLTVRLIETVGLARAKMLCLTGNFIDARTAYEWGLVVAVEEDVVERSIRLAGDIADNDQRAVQRMLPHLDAVAATLIAPGLALVGEEIRDWNLEFEPSAVASRRAAVFDRSARQRSTF